MFVYPSIDPVAFHVLGWPVHWYGLMYLIGFLAGWGLLAWRIKSSPRGFTQEQVSDIVFYAMLGVVIGGRVGYMLFYDFSAFISNPTLLFQPWKGGMSFHGGLLGVLIALWLCARRLKKPILALTDLIAPVVPIGLGAGRIGNFINGELIGRSTYMPWGMVFPNSPLPKHPSQLYEFALEGVLLFVILMLYSRRPKPLGAVSGLFAICYGIFRFTIEFFREPDAQMGFVAFGWMTQGQLLTIPLILVGIGLMVWGYRLRGVKHETVS